MSINLIPRLPDWLWQLPEPVLLAVLDADGAVFGPTNSLTDFYTVQLRELALHLIIGAPAGPPTDAAEFLRRCNLDHLIAAWNGRQFSGRGLTWDGVPDADLQIAALITAEVKVLPLLMAEFVNQFRNWERYPAQLVYALHNTAPEHAARLLEDNRIQLTTTTTEKEY